MTDALGGMAGHHVGNLMTNHDREIGLGLGDFKKAGINCDLPARHRKGVDLFGIIKDHEFPLGMGEIVGRDTGNALTNVLDAGVEFRVGGEWGFFF